jgi:hypothetical protein
MMSHVELEPNDVEGGLDVGCEVGFIGDVEFDF